MIALLDEFAETIAEIMYEAHADGKKEVFPEWDGVEDDIREWYLQLADEIIEAVQDNLDVLES